MTTMADRPNYERILRMFARFTAVGYLVYPVLLGPSIMELASKMPAWWTPLALVVVFGPGIALGAVTFRADPRQTRRIAAVAAGSYLVVVASVLPLWNGDAIANDDAVWLAGFPGLAALAAVVAVPASVAFAFAYMAVACVGVQLVNYVVRDDAPPDMLVPDIAFAIMFCSLFVGGAVMAFRTGRLLDATTEDTYASAAAAAAQQARVEERERFDGLIHDSVMATLHAGAGDQPHELVQTMATATLAELDEIRDEGAGPERDWDTGAAIDFLTEVARDTDPDVRVAVGGGPGDRIGQLPAEVVRALGAAQSEALRNSLRHAGPQARRSVMVSVQATGLDIAVRDDGAGFDPSEISPRRLGIAVSIRRRMARLPGGWAAVQSAPGAGTTVGVGWQRR